MFDDACWVLPLLLMFFWARDGWAGLGWAGVCVVLGWAALCCAVLCAVLCVLCCDGLRCAVLWCALSSNMRNRNKLTERKNVSTQPLLVRGCATLLYPVHLKIVAPEASTRGCGRVSGRVAGAKSERIGPGHRPGRSFEPHEEARRCSPVFQ